LLIIDLSSRASIAEASDELKKKVESLDVLIHNAAAFDITQKKRKKSVDGIETIWATNHLGPVLLSNTLLPLVRKSEQGRIITISSKGLIVYPRLKVNLEDPEFKNRKFSVPKAYYQSKRAQEMYTLWLADDLKDTAITVNCIRVTNVKIEINRYPDIPGIMKFMYRIKSSFSISPAEMAETYSHLATETSLAKTTGKIFDEKNKTLSVSAYTSDKKSQKAMMEMTDKYLIR